MKETKGQYNALRKKKTAQEIKKQWFIGINF